MKRVMGCIAMLGMLQTMVWAMPNQITYQGTLKEQGVPADGTRTMVFRLTNTDGSTVYWSSGNMDIAVTQGLFAANLSPTGVDWQNVSPYIETSIQGQVLLPRTPLSANAYSLMSGAVVDGVITTTKIADGSITTPKLAASAVTTGQIADGSVTASKLAAGTITPSQLADGAVTTPILADGAVTTGKMANGAVTTSQLADGSVTLNKLDPGVQGVAVPSGLVAIFTTTCPAGWSRFAALDGFFPMGGPIYGPTGGSATHTHTISTDGAHNHGGGTGGSNVNDNNQWLFGNPQGSGSHWNNFSDAAHSHSISMDGAHNHGGQTGAASSLPPYVQVVFCQKS